MESEKNPPSQSQNELDLGISPVTPKKTVDSDTSFLSKAKGLFGKKDTAENKFTVRKEPTFGDDAFVPTIATAPTAATVPTPQGTIPPQNITPQQNTMPPSSQTITSQAAVLPQTAPQAQTVILTQPSPTTVQPTVKAAGATDSVQATASASPTPTAAPAAAPSQTPSQTQTEETTAAPLAENSINTQSDNTAQPTPTESQVSAAAEAAGAATVGSRLKNPEKWKILQILPEKHRRLFIALLVLILLLIIVLALKPDSQTVASFEQNSNEIPVQFQSLDQSQPIETTVLDNLQAPPQAEADNTPAAANEPPAMEYVGNAEANGSHQTAQGPDAVQTSAVQTPIVAPPASRPADRVKTIATQAPENKTTVQQSTATTHRPTATNTASASHTQTVERKTAQTVTANPVKKETVRKAPSKETAKETVKTTTKAAENKAAQATRNGKAAPIVDAKPSSVKTTTAQSTNRQLLTVPQGVSLMQVFRNHNLNISDVNAMTKAAGAGNALSSFKPGDKVQVSVNAQGRVSELRMSNGAKFIRQADGSYQYQK